MEDPYMYCVCVRLENLGGPDGDAEGSFASLADTIMQQLLSKDVLYQPMKDIGSKYPTWLATHRSALHCLASPDVKEYGSTISFGLFASSWCIHTLLDDPYCLVVVDKHVSHYWRIFPMRHCTAYA